MLKILCFALFTCSLLALPIPQEIQGRWQGPCREWDDGVYKGNEIFTFGNNGKFSSDLKLHAFNSHDCSGSSHMSNYYHGEYLATKHQDGSFSLMLTMPYATHYRKAELVNSGKTLRLYSSAGSGYYTDYERL